MGAADTENVSTLRALPKAFNGTLTFACVIIAVSQINFGFDQGVFTNTQAMVDFTKTFGKWDAERGIYAIEPYFLSLLNSLNYIGFVEGDGLYRGEADVVVCDGFVGNILLKSSEGLATMIAGRIEALFRKNFASKVVGALALPLMKRLQAELSPARHNGASFLGLQGIVVKSHGSAGVQGFQSAIQRALIEIQENLPERLHGRLEDLLP